MTFLHHAPEVLLACLLIQTALAVTFFFQQRRQRQRANRAQRLCDALTVDNAGLRAQNARLIQSLARVRGVSRLIENFNPEKEKQT